jgi:DNA-binding NarL/FixJ family response regulator
VCSAAAGGGGWGPILVVDDDDSFRAFVATTFSSAGLAAREAADGEGALALARADPPALVVLDVCLPTLNGFELCRQLRDRFGDELPIILVSGSRTEPLDRAAGLLIGSDDYLIKPVDPNELLARARRLLSRSRTAEPGSASPEYGLTGRELAVLERLAAGLSQVEIAAELVISMHTVASHIQHIRAKLGVNSRAQAVAFAYEHGLLKAATAPTHRPPSDPGGDPPAA